MYCGEPLLSYLRKGYKRLNRNRWLPPVQALVPAVASLAMALAVASGFSSYGMEGPGDQDVRWVYSQKDYHWYFYETEETPHTGWLQHHGEWYWFDDAGRMAEGGFRDAGGGRYYFFINGHMAWNQFVGMKYYGQDGQNDPAHDVRLFGRETVTSEQKDLFSDYLYQVPRSWIARFMEEEWQMMFYTSKKYFSAPDTDRGIYYVNHNVDTHYRKLKFTHVDAVLQGFGEYVWYSAGLSRKNHVLMEQLWKEEPGLAGILEIPDYYASDSKFYFGKLFAAWLDGEKREKIWMAAPETGRILDEILHMHDEPELREWHRQRLEAEMEAVRLRREQRTAEEGYGPGVPRETAGSEAEMADMP